MLYVIDTRKRPRHYGRYPAPIARWVARAFGLGVRTRDEYLEDLAHWTNREGGEWINHA